MRHFDRTPTTALSLLAFLLATLAHAQLSYYENPALDFRIGYPSAWSTEEQMDATGAVTLLLTPTGNDGLTLVLAQPISESEAAHYLQQPRDVLMDEIWDGFVQEVPGAQITQTYDIAVAGHEARVIDYVGDGIGGTLLFFLRGPVIYTLASVGTPESFGLVQGGLEAMASSFEFLSSPVAQETPGNDRNPLDDPTGGDEEPENPLAPRNPLGGD